MMTLLKKINPNIKIKILIFLYGLTGKKHYVAYDVAGDKNTVDYSCYVVYGPNAKGDIVVKNIFYENKRPDKNS